MKTKRRVRHWRQAMVMMALFSMRGPAASAQNAPVVPPKEDTRNAEGFKELLDRVHAYVALHKKVNASLPALKPTPLPEMIAAHQQALARKIREARSTAEGGDIFTARAKEAFRRVVRDEFAGPHGHGARTTIRQGDPLKEVHLRANQPYPDGVPFTTVPPTLLLKFPRLPDEVAYRIVGRDLILLDVEANLVIDCVVGIFPLAD